ncbi:c-type cytochrome [Govanella unica]|uniref:Cytochrome c n=1 Tax=Govanella unica TaxID=2975056 RepID=A0A9X3TVT5_9PROT|nr:cytochrome c [Govania unica]MDA5192578.1 cytochrome c [Govania unica]
MLKKAMMLSMAAMVMTGAVHSAQAAEADDAVTYRKEVMKIIGGNMAGLSMALKGKIDDPKALQTHAEMLARTSSMALGAFKENTAGKGRERTTAKADIWSKWPEFEKDMKAFDQQAQKLASAAASGGAKAAGAEMAALGKSCKTCHDDFREKH